MAFNMFYFLIGRTLAEREGIADQSSQNRLALVGGLLGSSTTGLLVTTVLARREAETIPPTAPSRVPVPDVTGQPFADGRETLQDENFRISKTTEASDTVAGKVIRTEPPGGTLVEPESRVTVVVSSGSPVVEGPSAPDLKAKR